MLLPYITESIPGIDGQIKLTPEDFQVEEIPLYLPNGEGQHLYITIRRKNLNTKDVVKRLEKLFSLTEKDIGHSGLKDKNAVTTQCFSLSLGANFELDAASKLLAQDEELEVISIERHINKLKTGHLIGNRFTIKVKNTCDNAYTNALKIKEIILKTGIPNYYGPQRFGSKLDNWQKGKDILIGERKEKKHWLKKLYLSSLQSYIFNLWLKERIDSKIFCELKEHDLLMSKAGGRTFEFDLEKEHAQEFESGEISYTGPMLGHKLKWPNNAMKESELSLLNGLDLNFELFKNKFLMGTRRIAVLHLSEINITNNDDGTIMFSFSLPAGSYATSVLREFMKNDHINGLN